MSYKKIFDNVHGFIELFDSECHVLESKAFQRLRYIRQLGLCYLHYPGATHTRFEHSLGVMHLASKIYDRATVNCDKAFLCEIFGTNVQNLDVFLSFYRKALRIAAMSHDLGHLPFSHFAEKTILKDYCHEYFTLQVVRSENFQCAIKGLIDEGKDFGVDTLELICKLSVGKRLYLKYSDIEEQKPWTYVDTILTEMITGDYFGADRIDYLLRDAHATGLAYGNFDYSQLIDMVRIAHHEEDVFLVVEEAGVQAVESLIIARYFMHQRVYQHEAVKAYGYHVAFLMQELFDLKKLLDNVDLYLELSDNDVLMLISQIERNPNHPLHRHAEALTTPSKAFRVKKIDEKQLESVKKSFPKLTIAESAIKDPSMQFPVILKNGRITSVERLSRLLLPQFHHHFVIFDRENQETLKALEAIN